MRRIVPMVAVVLVGGFVASSAVAGTFVEVCVRDHASSGGRLPFQVDMETVCRCQGDQLAKLGYNPEEFHQAIKSPYANNSSGALPGDNEMREATGKYRRMMMDSGLAFMRCIQADAAKANAAKLTPSERRS